MKKILATLLACMCMVALCVPAYASGEILGPDNPNAGYTYVNPEKLKQSRDAEYTYLWDIYVFTLAPNSILTTGSNNKSISTSYTMVQVDGPKSSSYKVGACYADINGDWVSIGSSTMSASEVSFAIKHKAGKTTRGYFRNNSTGTARDLTYSFSAK